jgi:hypothetical protein
MVRQDVVLKDKYRTRYLEVVSLLTAGRYS